MPEYKNIISVWLNASKEGSGCYYAIRNETDEDIIIPSKKSVYANINTRMPVASKSVKIEDSQQENNADISEDIPY